MKLWATKRNTSSGFTIVELLIVVVVIAILAAITIVAYNGIQNRAKESALLSTASQNAKKLATIALTNGDTYPADKAAFLLAAGVSEDAKTSYQYSSAAPHASYCLTTTIDNKSLYTTNTNQTPSAGGCPGHNADGQTVITNLVINPSLESDAIGFLNIGNGTDRTVARTQVSDAKSGEYVLRITAGASGSIAGFGSNTGTLQPGRYTGSVWIRSNTTITVNPYFEGTSGRSNVAQQGAALQPGAWRQIWRTIDITSAGNVKVGFLAGTTIAQGNYLEADGFMFYEGDAIYQFADGNTSSNNARWAWDGVQNNSTSRGIPIN